MHIQSCDECRTPLQTLSLRLMGTRTSGVPCKSGCCKHDTSPVTAAALPHKRLLPNVLIKGVLPDQRHHLA